MRQRVQRAIHAIERREVEDGVGRPAGEVWLAELDASEDAEVGELVSTTLDGVEVAVDVESRRLHQTVLVDEVALMFGEVLGGHSPAAEIEVLGEDDYR